VTECSGEKDAAAAEAIEVAVVASFSIIDGSMFALLVVLVSGVVWVG